MYIPEHEQQCAFGHRHCRQDAHRLLCANTSKQHVQLHFDSACTAVRAHIQTWTCVQGTVQVGSGVRELLALLRSEEQWGVELGDVDINWHCMECVDGSTTEAQLHSTAAIVIYVGGGEDNADRSAARVRWLRLLRHLPHLKRLGIAPRRASWAIEKRQLCQTLCSTAISRCNPAQGVPQTARAHLHAAVLSHCNALLLRGLQRWCKLLLAGNCGV